MTKNDAAAWFEIPVGGMGRFAVPADSEGNQVGLRHRPAPAA